MRWEDSASACGGIGGRKPKMTHLWNLKAEWEKKDFKSAISKKLSMQKKPQQTTRCASERNETSK